jgi:uncharacterized protein (DUF58 family)
MIAVDLAQCHSRALAAAARFRLPLRSKVWRGQAGEFTGGGTGSSLDFQDHRSYVPGDDPRHINWQAYARTGSYTMKLFREEVRPVIELILDVSESMFFVETKATRTPDLFDLVTESSQAAGASIAVHLVRGDMSVALDPSTIRAHSWLEKARALKAAAPAQSPDLSRIPLRANSIRVLISDLLFAADPDPILRHLGQRHGTVLLFTPFLRTEADPDWSGNYEFIDPEENTRHPRRIEPATLRRYKEAYTNHFSLWKQTAIRHQTAMSRVPCEPDLIPTLYQHARHTLEST